MTLAKSAHAGTAPFGAEVVLLPDSSATGSATGSCSLAKRFDVFGLREVGSGLLREQLPICEGWDRYNQERADDHGFCPDPVDRAITILEVAPLGSTL